MGVLFTNNASTTLSAAISSTSATSISVASSSTFPAPGAGEYFYATIDDGTNNEIVKVTAVSGTTWTVVRGSDNTTASTFSSGDTVQLRAAAALLTDIQQNIAAKSANQTVYNATTASSATTYNVGTDPQDEANAMVFLDGVMQHHDTFSFSGSTLTFDAAPSNGLKLEVIIDNLINLQSSNLTVDTFTATNGQTAFTLSDTPAAEDNLIVFIEGVFQNQDSYSISNNTLTMSAGVTTGRKVVVYVINPVNIGTPSDGTVTSAKLSGNITTPGTLTVGSYDVAFDSPTFVVDNSNSRVGLGTASPSVPVDIVGDVKMSSTLELTSHLDMPDSANVKLGTGDDLLLYHDGTNSYIANTTGALKIATETSGIAVTIGHTTSETTVADNLTVTGTITGTLATAAQTNITSLGTLTTLTVDDITINGSTISDSGEFTIDTGDSIVLDADGAIVIKNAGSAIGRISNSSSNMYIQSDTSDADILIRGNDGGSTITALTLDMSDAGTATFNHDVNVGGDVNLTAGALSITGDGSNAVTFTESGAGIMTIATPDYFLVDSADDIILDADGADIRFRDGGAGFFTITNSSLDAVLKVEQSDEDLLIKGNDGGTEITALTLDMSDAGKAKFNGSIIIEKNSRVLEIADAAIQWYSYETSDYKSALFRADDYSFKNAGNTVVASINSSGAITATGATLTGNLSMASNTIYANQIYVNDRVGHKDDASTYIDFGVDTMTFATGGTAMFIDESARIGIGTTSPSTKLQIDPTADTYSATAYNDEQALRIRVANAEGNYAGIGFSHAGQTEGFMGLIRATATSDISDFAWQIYDGTNNYYREVFRISETGLPQFPRMGAGSGENAVQWWSAGGRAGGMLIYVASSKKYKKDITDCKVDSSKIYNLEAKSFKWNEKSVHEDKQDWGMIAEDVIEHIPELGTYDEEGEIKGLQYEKLSVLLLEEIKKLEARIKTLEDG